mmetsp:Transcript_12809/g.18256  ORF Transcript_12809/g.18256 Transcript_12809/m.18256 type:complete len:115 (+) Transcript_12809:403-747(+)
MEPLLQTNPNTKMRIQLQSRKKNPTTMEGDKSTFVTSFPVMFEREANPPPSPSRMLKTGPAKHAVIAMLARPFLAMVMLAERSPMEFPQASMVSPMMEFGILKTTPRKVRTRTS